MTTGLMERFGRIEEVVDAVDFEIEADGLGSGARQARR